MINLLFCIITIINELMIDHFLLNNRDEISVSKEKNLTCLSLFKELIIDKSSISLTFRLSKDKKNTAVLSNVNFKEKTIVYLYWWFCSSLTFLL